MTKARRTSRKRVYMFRRYGLDQFDPKDNHPEDGTLVVMTQPAGCPKNGTMNHYFIKDARTGEFYGLVSRHSLVRL